MIKQIPSKEIKEYLKKNPKCVLLDVRTKEEWSSDGMPDGEKLGLKTFFLSIQFADKSFNANFEEEFNKLNAIQRKALADALETDVANLAKMVTNQEKANDLAGETAKSFGLIDEVVEKRP